MPSNFFNINQYMRNHKLGSFNILKESDERFEDTDTPDSAADVRSWVPSFDDKNIKGWTAQYEHQGALSWWNSDFEDVLVYATPGWEGQDGVAVEIHIDNKSGDDSRDFGGIPAFNQTLFTNNKMWHTPEGFTRLMFHLFGWIELQFLPKLRRDTKPKDADLEEDKLSEWGAEDGPSPDDIDDRFSAPDSQAELDSIRKFLKLSNEYFEDWDWDGEELSIFDGAGHVIEKYTRQDLIDSGVLEPDSEIPMEEDGPSPDDIDDSTRIMDLGGSTIEKGIISLLDDGYSNEDILELVQKILLEQDMASDEWHSNTDGHVGPKDDDMPY